jgi:hypothetical protein
MQLKSATRLPALLLSLLAAYAPAQHPDIQTGPNADLGGILLMPADDV